MKNRPNKLDWLIYSIFRWWWNPIFIERPEMAKGFIKLFQMGMKDNKGKDAHVPSKIWWTR